jgi:hypothetical protein
MEKREILLPSKRYFKANEEDVTINVKLEGDAALLRQGERDIILDLPTLFNDERVICQKYKIYGKIKTVFRNMYSGTTDYNPLLKNLYATDAKGYSETDPTQVTFGQGYMPYSEFAFLRTDVLRENNTPIAGGTLGIFTPNIELTGQRYTGHTTTTAIDAPYKNWNLYLSYVDSHDITYPMMYTLSGATGNTCDNVFNYCFTSGDGIPFRVVNNGNYYTLVSPVEHGMKQGEYVILSATTITTDFWVTGKTYTTNNIVRYGSKKYISTSNVNLNNNPEISGNVWLSYTGKTRNFHTLPLPHKPDTEKYRIFQIESVGDGIYNSEKYVINILKSEFASGTTLSTVVFGRRCLDDKNITGSTSNYYVHKHKTLTTKDDYILDKVGFETPIWERERKILFQNALNEPDVIVERNNPESLLFDFKKSFTLTGITNNLGYTPTEVYSTIIFRNSNGFFDYPPKVGYKFNFHDTWVDQIFDGDGSREKSMTGNTYTFTKTGVTFTGVTFTGGTVLSGGTTLMGAYVEYNVKEVKERIISEAFHRFSHRKILTGIKPLFDHKQDDPLNYSGVSETNMVGYYYQPHHRIKLRQLSPYIETSNTKDILNLPENAVFDPTDKVWRWRDLYDHGFIDPEGNGTNFPFLNNMHYVVNDINFYLRNEKSYKNKSDGLTGFGNSLVC